MRDRRTIKRHKILKVIDKTIEAILIGSLLTTGFLGVAALGCYGIAIIDANSEPTILRLHDWKAQTNVCLGGMTVAFSVFLGSAILGGMLSDDVDYK
ncbi:hypothetical protein [Halotia branconii]|uniref:Uncharacterized protein n=1 Tax=Halotia branconii CENA392 TaxID=1539056 RepID=A0AAJ6NZ64_9CYAN|nr:hypothetical protein [Halotia branconii]WGV29199.1 hypothetical protein QI031_30830 [Halotia branconii CENA392]